MSGKFKEAREGVLAEVAVALVSKEWTSRDLERALDEYADAIRLECSRSPLAAIEDRVKALESRWGIQDEHERESAEYD